MSASDSRLLLRDLRGHPPTGPGERESTEQALRLLPPLTRGHRVLDIGCGAGAGASTSRGPPRIRSPPSTTTSRCLPARQASRRAWPGGSDHGEGRRHEQPELPGRIVRRHLVRRSHIIIGFAKGLVSWRRLLAPAASGRLRALLVRADRPAEVEDFFRAEGVDIGEMDDRRRAIVENGYRLVGDFVCPPLVGGTTD